MVLSIYENLHIVAFRNLKTGTSIVLIVAVAIIIKLKMIANENSLSHEANLLIFFCFANIHPIMITRLFLTCLYVC